MASTTHSRISLRNRRRNNPQGKILAVFPCKTLAGRKDQVRRNKAPQGMGHSVRKTSVLAAYLINGLDQIRQRLFTGSGIRRARTQRL